MGRGDTWPAHSWSEWMVGQNFRPRKPNPSTSLKSVLKVELSDCDSSSDEVYEVTHVGRHRRGLTVKKKASVAHPGKKVRFAGRRKSALKGSISSSQSSDTLVEISEDSDTSDIDTSDGDTSDLDSSDIDSSDVDVSDDDASFPKRKSKLKDSKVVSCKNKTRTARSSEAADDVMPHRTCKCKECVQGRKILHAITQSRQTDKDKAADKGKGKGKAKQKDKKASVTSDESTSEEENKQAAKGKTNKKQKQKPAPKVKKSVPKADRPSPILAPPKTIVDKSMFKLPEYPEKMKPTLIEVPITKVMQIEHAQESRWDPRPNAFYDGRRGIARVYHGEKYGNAEGTLYGDYPVKTSHAAAPFSADHGRYSDPLKHQGQSAQSAQHAAAPFASPAPSRSHTNPGGGLSGLAPPPTPTKYGHSHSQQVQQEGWGRPGSVKGSNNGHPDWVGTTNGWGNTGNDSKKLTPSASHSPPVDLSKDQNSQWPVNAPVSGNGSWGGKKEGWGSTSNGRKTEPPLVNPPRLSPLSSFLSAANPLKDQNDKWGSNSPEKPASATGSNSGNVAWGGTTNGVGGDTSNGRKTSTPPLVDPSPSKPLASPLLSADLPKGQNNGWGNTDPVQPVSGNGSNNGNTNWDNPTKGWDNKRNDSKPLFPLNSPLTTADPTKDQTAGWGGDQTAQIAGWGGDNPSSAWEAGVARSDSGLDQAKAASPPNLDWSKPIKEGFHRSKSFVSESTSWT